MKHTINELKQMQSLPLEVKIKMTERRIREWHEHWQGDVYVAFSGGKDSTVLLDIARRLYPDVPAVFVDTGLEYPEIREFVKTFENVVELKPKKNFKQVVMEYGYPFFGKEVANNLDGARKYITILTDRQTDRQTDRISLSVFHIPTTTEEYAELASTIKNDLGKVEGSPQRLAILLGMLDMESKVTTPNNARSRFSMEKYKFALDAPFKISDRCCDVMKKAPAKEYNKKTGRKPMTAQMANESRLRLQKWLQNGCNAYEGKQVSNPMSFWTEQDVLHYLKERNIKICSVYGDIVEDTQSEFDGQLTFEQVSFPLKTSGCQRTGCMFCGFGCHLEKGEGRFERMKKTHPKQYDYIMRPVSEGGLGYKEIIDWINENGKMNIKY